jgi:hypothetical protein
MTRQALIGGLVTAALAALVACGGGSAATAPGTDAVNPNPQSSSAGAGQGGAADAGSLLTAEMAASVIGGSPTKVDLPVQPGGGVASLASYATASGDDVTILIERLPGLSGSVALQAALTQQNTSGEMQAVSGVGDAAGKVVSDHDATLAFTKGDSIVVLAAKADGMTGGDLESKLESLARQIAGNL